MAIQISFPDTPPMLVVIAGPCRVGTTALTNIFVQASIPSHMQPIKSARRAIEIGGKIIPWIIDGSEGKGDFVVCKETLGPETPAEFFNPIQILLEAGYPKEKLILIPIVRDPVQAYASWIRMWGEVDLEKFKLAYQLTSITKTTAKINGIKTIPYVHEVIQDNQADIVISQLFKRLGLVTSSDVIHNWGALRQNGNNASFYDDPPEKFIDGIKNRGEYKYEDLPVTEKDVKCIEHNPVLKDIYESFRKSCEESLKVTIK